MLFRNCLNFFRINFMFKNFCLFGKSSKYIFRIRPRDPRPLSTREGARLQGFPDDYIFCGNRGDKHLQIGNAVPTFLSIAIKNSVKSYLKGEIIDGLPGENAEESTLF